MTRESKTAFRVLDTRFSAAVDEMRTRPIPAGFRPHSVLLGFYTEDEVREFLREKAVHSKCVDDLMQAWQRAHSHIGELEPLAADPHAAPPSKRELAAAANQFMSEPRVKALFSEGTCSIELAEISKLIPVVPNVDLLYSESLGAAELDPSNPSSAAELCFAHKYVRPFSVSLDQGQKSVIISGIHPAFEVVGLQCGQQEEDVLIVRFMVTGPPNVVTALRYQGRLFLSNGYHRVHRLMTAGFAHVPCLVREASKLEQFAPNGPLFFRSSVLLAARPPVFTDFADPLLGIIAPLRAMRRVIRVRPDEYLVAS